MRPSIHNTVCIVLSSGTNTYTQPSLLVCNYSVNCVETGDFDNDGNQDFVYGDYGSNFIEVLKGNGTGSFTQTLTYTIGSSYTAWINCNDFNNDGFKDIVVGGSNEFSVFMNNASGGFLSPVVYPAVPTAYIVSEDFNNDGFKDLYIHTGSGYIMMKNLGSGTFQSAGSGMIGSVSFDLNNDGLNDLMGLNSGSLSISINQGNFNFSAATLTNAGVSGAINIVKCDLNGDNKRDIVVAGYNQGLFGIHLNNGSGGLLAPIIYTPTPSQIFIEGIRACDVDNNGMEDLVYQIGNVQDIRIIQNCLFLETIENQSSSIRTNIIPNPSTGGFKIKTEADITHFEVRDINGKTILQAKQTDQIDLSNYSNGIYFLKIETVNGDIGNYKLIKTD